MQDSAGSDPTGPPQKKEPPQYQPLPLTKVGLACLAVSWPACQPSCRGQRALALTMKAECSSGFVCMMETQRPMGTMCFTEA